MEASFLSSSMELKNWIILIALAAVWGSAFMFIKIAAPDFGPVALVNLRLLLAGTMFLPFLLQRKYLIHFKSYLPGILVLAVMNNALPFFLFAYGSLNANSNMLAILNGSTAFMTMTLAYFWIKESISAHQIIGLVIGFIGIIILVNPSNTSTTAISSIACLLGAFCYSFSGCFIQKYSQYTNKFVLIGWSLFFGGLLMTPFSIFYLPSDLPETKSILALLWLGLVSTGITYLGYVRLIETIGALKTSTVAYLIPVFGIIWGYLFLKEEVTIVIFLGFILIMAGIYFANYEKRTTRRIRTSE